MNQLDLFTWIHQLGVPVAILAFVGIGIWKITKYVGFRLFESDTGFISRIITLSESFITDHRAFLEEVGDHLRAVQLECEIHAERDNRTHRALLQIAKMIKAIADDSGIDVEDAFHQVRLYLKVEEDRGNDHRSDQRD